MTIDQQDSRTSDDAVPAVLEVLEPVATAVPFSRTIGDEVQGVLVEPAAVAEAVRRVVEDSSGWHIGIGIGEVDHPLPESSSAGRGPAFYAAREAVEAAKTAPAHLVVRSGDEETRRANPDGAASVALTSHLDLAEAALRLLASALSELRPQSRGYVGFHLDHPDATQAEIAARFDVSQQAVSRVLAPGTAEIIRGALELAGHHLRLSEGAAHVD